MILFNYFLLLICFNLINCNRIKHSIYFVDLANNDLMNRSTLNDQAIKLIDLIHKTTPAKSSLSNSSLAAYHVSTKANQVLTSRLITSSNSLTQTSSNSMISSSSKKSSTLNTIKPEESLSTLSKHDSLLIRLNSSKLIKNNNLIECLNCSELKDKSECEDFEDYDMMQLVNIFCCECNPYK